MIYIYKHPSEERYIELIQSMNDEHVFFDESGLQWERVWTVPNMGIDTKINPLSEQKFLDKTAKSGTYGDLLDRSKEWSHMRAEKNGGVDPVEKAANEKWSKERGGRKLPKKFKDLEITPTFKKK